MAKLNFFFAVLALKLEVITLVERGETDSVALTLKRSLETSLNCDHLPNIISNCFIKGIFNNISQNPF